MAVRYVREREYGPAPVPLMTDVRKIDDAVAVHENVVPVLDKGFLALDGSLASDLAVVNGARVSFNQSSQSLGERDEGLIRYLMRDRHGSPFEHLLPLHRQGPALRRPGAPAPPGRALLQRVVGPLFEDGGRVLRPRQRPDPGRDRKSTRLNS